MSLKARFLDAIDARSAFAPAVKLLLEKNFGEVMYKFPEQGGSVEAFFRFPVLTARESAQGEYQMMETFGKGRTKERAILDLYDRYSLDAGSGLVLRYDGESREKQGEWDYKAFVFNNGDFQYLGIWSGNRRPSRVHSVNQDITLQAAARPYGHDLK